MILKDAYNFYSSKLFLHPYNSKVLQRLDVSEGVGVSRPDYCKNEVSLSELGVKLSVVLKSLLNTQVSVGLPDMLLSSVFRPVQLVR